MKCDVAVKNAGRSSDMTTVELIEVKEIGVPVISISYFETAFQTVIIRAKVQVYNRFTYINV